MVAPVAMAVDGHSNNLGNREAHPGDQRVIDGRSKLTHSMLNTLCNLKTDAWRSRTIRHHETSYGSVCLTDVNMRPTEAHKSARVALRFALHSSIEVLYNHRYCIHCSVLETDSIRRAGLEN